MQAIFLSSFLASRTVAELHLNLRVAGVHANLRQDSGSAGRSGGKHVKHFATWRVRNILLGNSSRRTHPSWFQASTAAVAGFFGGLDSYTRRMRLRSSLGAIRLYRTWCHLEPKSSKLAMLSTIPTALTDGSIWSRSEASLYRQENLQS